MNPDKRIRRLQNLLYTCGLGIILFTVWTGIRTVALLIEEGDSLFDMSLSPELLPLVKIITGILVFIILLFIVLIHFYIGKSAMAVSKGSKQSNFYIVLSILIILCSLLSFIFSYMDGKIFQDLDLKDYVSIIMDITTNIILIELIVFSLSLNKLRK